MRFLKRDGSERPRLTLVLLDWSVRESFHLLHYLKKQTVPRDSFEVQVIEFYSRVSEALRTFEEEVDSWILLDMPEDCYYHKHLMYNVGIAYARGDIVVICDSDAMVRETFLESIQRAFERKKDLALHLDQFRNVRRDFYPFNYPSFEEVLGEGCINRAGEVTRGLADRVDTVHSRNYGACFCARRDQLIEIGGADEHVDFLGHVCGPYDLTFRLTNYGCDLEWHEREFMYHTWHPGSDGVGNYMGPHDGMNMSTTSFEALLTRRVLPHRENRAIRALREGGAPSEGELGDLLVDPSYASQWKVERLDRLYADGGWTVERPLGRGLLYRGFRVRWTGEEYVAIPAVLDPEGGSPDREEAPERLQDPQRSGIKHKIDRRVRSVSRTARLLGRLQGLFALGRFLAGKMAEKARTKLRALLRELAASIRARLRAVSGRLRTLGGALAQRSSGPTGSLRDTTFSVYLVSRRLERRETAVLLLGPTRSKRYFQLLVRMGVLRRIRVYVAEDSDSLQAVLHSLEESGSDQPLLIDSDLYVLQYSAIASHPRVRRAWIV